MYQPFSFEVNVVLSVPFPHPALSSQTPDGGPPAGTALLSTSRRRTGLERHDLVSLARPVSWNSDDRNVRHAALFFTRDTLTVALHGLLHGGTRWMPIPIVTVSHPDHSNLWGGLQSTGGASSGPPLPPLQKIR